LQVLLPPIVFAAGFNMKKRNCFRNIGTIVALVDIGHDDLAARRVARARWRWRRVRARL
jgi:hypothetical protein